MKAQRKQGGRKQIDCTWKEKGNRQGIKCKEIWENSEFDVRVWSMSKNDYNRYQWDSRVYPIYTSQGARGGIYVVEGATLLVEKRLNEKQNELLQRLSKNLKGKDAKIMQSILLTYGKIKY